jgi:hypothetical protein
MKNVGGPLATKESKRSIVPEHGGVAKEERNILFTTRGETPLELDYAQTYGMGASGGGKSYELLPSGSITDVSDA